MPTACGSWREELGEELARRSEHGSGCKGGGGEAGGRGGGGEGGGGRGGEEEEGEEQLIKSNNPHLAGGEKTDKRCDSLCN